VKSFEDVPLNFKMTHCLQRHIMAFADAVARHSGHINALSVLNNVID